MELPPFPPGSHRAASKSIGYVLEGAGFEVTNIVDEPTARCRRAEDPGRRCVVDVGGGYHGDQHSKGRAR